MDVKNSVLFLILGWLLGILGHGIQERNRLRHVTKRVISGIASELSELREQCAGITFHVEAKAGRLTKDLLTWQRRWRSDRPLPPPLDQRMEVTYRLERVDDIEFQQIASQFKAPEGRGTNLRDLAMPYTETKIADLELISEAGRRHVLEILSRIRIFNQQLEEGRFFFKLTFAAGISPENHASASAQDQASSEAASQQSRLIVELVTLALKELEQ